MRLPVLLLVPLAFACNETKINASLDWADPPNPPDLELPVTVDRVVQTPVPAVDVLWVIDDSCSMSEEQNALASNFNYFINYFLGSGLDYHVGVLTTGWDDPSARGKLQLADDRRWIDETTRRPVEDFREMAILGTDGPADEKGRAQVYGAIELLSGDGQPNEGFYREDAALAIIVISDENDASGSRPVARGEFVDWLVDLKADPGMVTFSSIVGPNGGCETASEGTDYLEVTRAVGGIEWPICDSNWSTVLEELGIQAAGLQREFYLSEVPVEDSIEVWVNLSESESESFDVGTDYEYSRARNSIRFHSYVPDPLSEVYISYTPLAASQNQTDVED